MSFFRDNLRNSTRLRTGLPVALIIVLFCAAPPVSAAKYAGEFLSTGGGAAHLGLGGAGVALPTGAESAFWNPALLSSLDGIRGTLMHSERFAGLVGYDAVSFSIRRGAPPGGATPLTLGIRFRRLAADGIPVTELLVDSLPPVLEDGSVNYKTTGSGTSRDFVCSFTAAARHPGFGIDLGVSLKLIYRNLLGSAAMGAGLDAGLYYRWRNGLAAGLSLADITTTPVVWDTGVTDLVTPTTKMGVSWTFGARESLFRGACALDADLKFDNLGDAADLSAGSASLDVHAGGECWINNAVALRTGLESCGRLTAGATLAVSMVRFDYAFLMDDELGHTHRVSMSVELDTHEK